MVPDPTLGHFLLRAPGYSFNSADGWDREDRCRTDGNGCRDRCVDVCPYFRRVDAATTETARFSIDADAHRG